ncbi:capsule assembly Wzi family protein [Alishewanella sp. d11]|uniref:capsule assembly Wzi family protein n=1 Tax=Alishewanella sp. d11 TaxID=3414030 RepID=UPI003BF803ED
MRLSSFYLAASISLIASPLAFAAPWVDTQDAYLHQSIQQLASAGLIKTPINTLPIMWQPLVQDLANIDVNQLTPANQHAFFRVQAAASFARQSHTRQVAVKGASDAVHKNGFGDNYQQKAQLSLGTEVTGGNWSAGIVKQFNHDSFINSANSATNPLSENTDSWNNTYAAYTAGNWVLSASLQQQWWGPGISHSFNQNANQQPTRLLQVNRLNPNLPLHDSLDWLGAVTLNVQYGYHAGTDVLRHATFFASRVGVKPFDKLEIGLSQRSISPKQPEQLLNLAPLSLANIRTFGADAQYNLTAAAAVYGEVSQQLSNRDYQSASAWLLGARYHLGNQYVLLRFYAEYQQQPAQYYAWQNISQQADSQAAHKQLVAGLHVSTPTGQAGYIRLTQRDFQAANVTEAAPVFTLPNAVLVQAETSVNLGYQFPLFQGLLQADYQLAKLAEPALVAEPTNLESNKSYQHSVGLRWEWRW